MIRRRPHVSRVSRKFGQNKCRKVKNFKELKKIEFPHQINLSYKKFDEFIWKLIIYKNIHSKEWPRLINVSNVLLLISK